MAFIIGFVTWPSEISIRTSGYVLQFIGMILAIKGLLGIRKHFGQPSLTMLFVNWVKRFPQWKKDAVVLGGTVQLGAVEVRGRIGTWNPDDPAKSIEQRIEKIIRNLEIIKEGQHNHSELLNVLNDSHEDHKKKINERASKMEEEFQANLESSLTDGLERSLVGLVWLLVGISMSTMAPELYRWPF